MINKSSNERGYATFLSLLIIMVLSVLVFSFVEISYTELHSLKLHNTSFQAFANAESGIEDLISKYYNDILYDETNSLSENTTLCPNQIEYSQDFANGTYHVCIDEVQDNRFIETVDCDNDGTEEENVTKRTLILESKGNVKNVTKTIHATLNLEKNACDSSVFIQIEKWNQNN